MQLLGEVVRLQVQRSSLKVGEKPHRRYDPAPITAVARLSLDEGGVIGWDVQGERLVDVHHRDHPASKNAAGRNGISLGFTGHYAAMRRRFGEHVGDGSAGENILVRAEGLVTLEDLAAGVVIETLDGGLARLSNVLVAEPCVEFTRFCLRHPDDAPSDADVTAGLSFLRHGLRGFYLSYQGEPVALQPGAPVFLES
jgi:hypothetical protein